MAFKTFLFAALCAGLAAWTRLAGARPDRPGERCAGAPDADDLWIW